MKQARLLTCLIALVLLAVPTAEAQVEGTEPARPAMRFGFGFTATMTTDFANPVGPGLHARLAIPVNQDLSFAAGGSIAGFVLGGREEAVYYAAPQVLAIVTLNATLPRSPYVLFGLGGHLPFYGPENNSQSGPVLTGGIGWALVLQQSSVYFEVLPGLVVARKAAKLTLPINIGVIL